MNIEQKIKHLENLGFSGDLTEVRNLYTGLPFNINDSNIVRLFSISQKLCDKFTSLSSKLIIPEQKDLAEKQKAEILDILFPGHGLIFGGGDDLRAVIGMVDIGDYVYINARVHFNPTSIVKLNDYVFLATNITFGHDKYDASQTFDCASFIEVGANTWICSSTSVLGPVLVGGKSVIGLGSYITPDSKIAESTLAFGAPCMSHKFIDEGYVSKQVKASAPNTDEEIKFLLQHVSRFGFTGDMTQFIKMLKGEDYNCLAPNIGDIHTLSHHLCSEYNDRSTSIERKRTILDILFPINGGNLSVGENLYCDIMGATKFGANVSVGNNAIFAGNIRIGDNVKIGNDVVVQCIGHRIYYKDRLLGFTPNGTLIEYNTSGTIQIKNNINVANGTKIKPGIVLNRDTKENELVLH